MDEGKKLYRFGKDNWLKEDYTNARICYEKAALEYNHGKSYNQLGYMYQCGVGLSINIEKAIEYYKKGISLGNRHSKINLSWLYLYTKDITAARKIIEELYNDSKCQHATQLIGMLYLFFLNDEEKGLFYLKSNIINNYANSFVAIAIYLNTKDPKNRNEILNHIFKAIELGSSSALAEINSGIFNLTYQEKLKVIEVAIDGYNKCDKYIKSDYIREMGKLLNNSDIIKLFFHKIEFLKAKIDNLENHIYYSPDGPGFLEAKNDFINHIK